MIRTVIMRFYLDDLSEPLDFTYPVPSPVQGRDLRPDCACGKPRAARPKTNTVLEIFGGRDRI